MKTRILYLMLAFFTLCSVNLVAQNKKEKKNNKEEVVFDVPMTCHNCQKKIEHNLRFEKGISNMKVDLDSKTVMIQYNPNKTNQAKLEEAFEKLGYEVSVHQDKAQE